MPLQEGKIVGRSDLAELQVHGSQYWIGIYPRAEWLAQYRDAPVFFFGDGSYMRLHPNQKSVVQAFCHQGLTVYEDPDNPDQPPLNICQK